MDEEAAFIAALVADPSDRTAALVFADWLDDRDDPRGLMMRNEEVRAWMAPTYANPLPGLATAIETGKKITQASKILALIGERSIPTLVALLKHTTPLVRLRAAKALRLMGAKAKDAVPVLTELVKETNSEDADLRREAIALLGVLRVKQVVTDEFAKGLDSEVAADRLTAVEAMSKLRTTKAASSLCKALGDSSDEVRRAAAQQLRWIASPAMAFAVEPLRKALADTHGPVRNLAVTALGKIGPKASAAVPDLLPLLPKTPAKVRVVLINSLVAIGVGIPEVLEAILAELRDPDTRHTAGEALLKWPTLPDSAAPALLELVRDTKTSNPYGDGLVIRSGLQALTKITSYPPEVQKELRAHLTTEHGSTVTKALGEIGPPAAVFLPDLAKAFSKRSKDWDPYALAKTLGKIGGEGITTLVEALGRELTKDDPTPAAAAAGLKEAGSAAIAALPALLAMLRRKNLAYGRVFVLNALAAIGPDAAVAVPDIVARILDDDHTDNEAGPLFAALRVFGPAVLPFVPQLTERLRQPSQSRNHARITELLTGLIPHSFDALPVFREVLRQATASDFYPDTGFINLYRRREVACAALAGLAALGPTATVAIPDMVLADQTFNTADVREKVFASYGAVGEEGVPYIHAALSHPQSDVRFVAIKALVASGDESMESQDALRKLETDAKKGIRALATAALRKMGTRKKKRPSTIAEHQTNKKPKPRG